MAFTTPPFLENCGTDDWHKKMFEILPADIDKSWGNHTWNLTRPTALTAAMMCEFILPEVIKIFCPDWSYGTYLDKHADDRAMKRRAATPATGEVTITGEVGTLIPAGSLFATAALNNEPSVSYKTIEAVAIPDSGNVTVGIECTQVGIVGNTTAGTIVLVGSRLSGITAVTNYDVVSGGTEEETDESLQNRITEYDRTQGESFTGCVADYKRWAESVNGVGEATVIPAQDDSGTVTIVVMDANGAPATDDICEDVYNHIMRPDSPGERLVAPNAVLNVIPPATVELAVSAIIELEEGYTIGGIKSDFAKALTAYLPQSMDAGEIKYSQIWTVLGSVKGVHDFTDLMIGINHGGGFSYGTSNITIAKTELPSVSESDLILTAGIV